MARRQHRRGGCRSIAPKCFVGMVDSYRLRDLSHGLIDGVYFVWADKHVCGALSDGDANVGAGVMINSELGP